jgi:hypothetical protein
MEFEHAPAQPDSETMEHARTFPLLDWTVALGGLWLIGGLHLDGWAHHHIRLDTFFSPWHAVLYSGFGVTALPV